MIPQNNLMKQQKQLVLKHKNPQKPEKKKKKSSSAVDVSQNYQSR
jgi:hypothetical protein